MSNQKIQEGREGEEIAANFLQKKGYKIIDKNFRCKIGEIDIIAIGSNKTLVFIEVKTRGSEEFGTPLEAINSRKLKSLIHVAQYYKLVHPKLPEQLRIDAISVKLSNDQKPIVVEHVENISGF